MRNMCFTGITQRKGTFGSIYARFFESPPALNSKELISLLVFHQKTTCYFYWTQICLLDITKFSVHDGLRELCRYQTKDLMSSDFSNFLPKTINQHRKPLRSYQKRDNSKYQKSCDPICKHESYTSTLTNR